jgi:glycosyltransferase involved in cell wall biosynthesis
MHVSRPRWSTRSPYKRIAWEQVVAPVALRRERVDLLHAMAFVAPVLSPCPVVVTVFDLSFLLFPSAFKPFNRCYLRLMTRASVRRAKQVIAISESTRRDVIAWLGVPADRVRTIYCGVDHSLQPASKSEIESFRREKGLPERYVLFLGTLEPRKNVARLVEAFADLCASERRETANVHLVLAGAKGWLCDSLYAQIDDLGMGDRIHLPGYVPEDEKRLWYSAATCFCYPSLYEGFGLPPLEAMACGVPVITSNLSSLPEVVGDAGITVPPKDALALKEALRRVLTEPTLRAELAEKGLARARRFTWAEAARQTADTYHLAREGA